MDNSHQFHSLHSLAEFLPANLYNDCVEEDNIIMVMYQWYALQLHVHVHSYGTDVVPRPSHFCSTIADDAIHVCLRSMG